MRKGEHICSFWKSCNHKTCGHKEKHLKGGDCALRNGFYYCDNRNSACINHHIVERKDKLIKINEVYGKEG